MLISKPKQRFFGTSCKGRLNRKFTVGQIEKIIGRNKRVSDDPDKVKFSFQFLAYGMEMAIWDYKGGRWSLYGNKELFEQLFGEENIEWFYND